jgi:hypothetical protein
MEKNIQLTSTLDMNLIKIQSLLYLFDLILFFDDALYLCVDCLQLVILLFPPQ